MAIVRWDPFGEVLRMQRDMDRIFSRLGSADVEVEVTDGVLSIRGERRQEEKQEGEDWLVCESCYGSFERSLTIPEGIDPATITADYKDGILVVHVPKALEASRPKTTKIEIGGAGAPKLESGSEA